jgi:transposase
MLKPENKYTIPETTQQVARAAFPKGNLYLQMRDEMGPIFADENFAELYPSTGQPTESPWRLAMITIMQYVEGLTDRQAAEAVRGRIDWKYALGLELTDAGFDYSVLSEFRQRLVHGGKAELLFEKFLEHYAAKGLLKGKGTQRTDATHVVAHIRRMNRLELVGETLRRVLNELAQQTPEWLAELVQAEWVERYGRRFDTYRLPKSENTQRQLAEQIGRDGRRILEAALGGTAPPVVRTAKSVERLRQIWLQQYYWVEEEEPVHWRTKQEWGLPPAHQMLSSPDETDARYGAKGNTYWTGYKIHLTETCQAHSPHLITQVETTLATTHDSQVTERIEDQLVAGGRQPQQHLLDSGYVDVGILVAGEKKGITVIGPVKDDQSWQARTPTGLDATQFEFDWQKMQATCPQGKISRSWKIGKTRAGEATYKFTFAQSDCAACEARSRCTRSKKMGRQVCVYPPEKQQRLIQARRQQRTDAFKQTYNLRAGIEGTISQAVNRFDARKARYRGSAKVHLQHLVTAAAINFVRVADWLAGVQPETTRSSPFVLLAQSL